MKILFFTPSNISDTLYGGGKAARNRYYLLSKIAEIDCYELLKKSNIASFLSLVEGHFPPLRNNIIKEILHLIKTQKYDLVIMDSSICGTLVRKIKESIPNIPVLSLFQNCEKDYIAVRFGSKNSLKKEIYTYLVGKEERLTLKYSDKSVALSERDNQRLFDIYDQKASNIIPLFLNDEFKNDINSQDRYCLLFSSDVIANIDGIRWFIQEVSPYVKLKTVVAGQGSEKYRQEFISLNNQINVIGYVEDLSRLYRDAACVCIPLFSGSGMKVKTVEALMYGKTIFGTDEAFAGFNFDKYAIATICNDANSFIVAINNFYELAQSRL